MTYQQTLDWMFAQLPMYQQKGKIAYNAKLDGIKLFTAHLNHPEKKFKSIHIAGTNGKGSSSHMLAAILQEAGYRVGLYTSPHLKDFRERIKYNGKPISQKMVVSFIKAHKDYLENHKLSFFEMTVGMAFDYFTQKKVDIAIIEVGLGGRLDSTNIISPEVALITNIGYDHQDQLGNTLQKIAIEKAGIIKPNIPVVISETQEDLVSTFKEQAKSKKAKIVFADKGIHARYQTDLLGAYQERNMKGVVATLNELKGFEVSEAQIKSGLQKVVQHTGLLGRWQVLGKKPLIVCDAAHNSEGLLLVLEQIEKHAFNDLHMVLGFVKDKNLDVILPLFPKHAKYYFSQPAIARGQDVKVLAKKATKCGLKGLVYTSVKEALEAAVKNAYSADFIFVGGSTFTVAEVV